MKLYSDEALAALASGEAVVSGAFDLGLTTPLRVWGGYGEIELGGDVFTGVGDRGLAQVTGGALGSAEQGATLTLSGVDPDVLAVTETLSARNATGVLWRLIFDGPGKTLLDASVHLRGRVDKLTRKDVIGGASALVLALQGAVRGLGRALGRTRSDADQRLLVGTDGGMKHITYAGDLTLTLGGQSPARAASVLPTYR